MKIAIVTPVFNDWTSLAQLIGAIENVGAPGEIQFFLFFLFPVCDGSSEPAVVDVPLQTLRRIREIEIIGLICNLGHQRAIAVGLVEMYRRRHGFDAILVIDAGGEDRPEDIRRLIDELRMRPRHLICAQRRQWPGLFVFRVWYECYKLIFRLLTGAHIDFGNLCLIPADRLEAVVSNSSLRSNLARHAGALAASAGALADRSRTALRRTIQNELRIASDARTGCDRGLQRHRHGAPPPHHACDPRHDHRRHPLVVSIKLFTTLAIPGWATSGRHSVHHPRAGLDAIHHRLFRRHQCAQRQGRDSTGGRLGFRRVAPQASARQPSGGGCVTNDSPAVLAA